MAQSYGKNDQSGVSLERRTVTTDPRVMQSSAEQDQSDGLPNAQNRARPALVKRNEFTRTAAGTHQTSEQSVEPSTLKGSSKPTASAIEDGLMAAIEGEVIPRLLLTYGQMAREDEAFDAFLSGRGLDGSVEGLSSDDEAAAPGSSNTASPSHPLSTGQQVDPSDVVEFTRILIAHDAPVAVGFVDMQIARGVNVADLLLDLCTPAARELGEMWLRDECSFCDVTIALSSLELVILRCGGPEKTIAGKTEQNRSVLLGAMPGNQHMFGLLIVKELFRRSGWLVRAPKANDAQALLDAVRSNYFSIVGLSVGAEEDLPACQALVKDLRRVSCNPKLLVIVGGHGIQRANSGTRALDVDLIARDGREGLDQIERMVNRVEPSLPMN